MKKIICSILLFSATFFLRAHNSQIATMALVQGEDNQWTLQLSSSFDGYRYQLLYNYPDIDVNNLPAEEFQKLLMQYLEDNIELMANGNAMAKLRNGYIEMGHHTVIKFNLTGLPDKLKSLDVKLTGLNETSNNNCVFKIITKDNKSKNFFLKKDNNFELSIYSRDNQFQVVTVEEASLSWVVVGLGSLAVLTMFMISKLFTVRRPGMRKVS